MRTIRSGFESVGKALSSIHRLRGDAWIDSLGKTGEVLREWRAALVADGGEEKITAQQRAIIELPTRTYLLLETFRAHTSRAAPLPGGYSEAVAIVDRQSGKSRIAEQEREITRWKKRAERAEVLLDVQKKVAALLGTPLESEK